MRVEKREIREGVRVEKERVEKKESREGERRRV